jgi:DNA-directed RNA polymerase sigma subunit (sigma70/sigma32)
MSRQTLTPTASESDLIALVKDHQDSDALTRLVEQHAGIYISVIGRYSQCYPNVIKHDDLVDDRFFNIHRFILDYDPSRGSKLCTYIGDRTDWMCKDMMTRSRENPVATGTYGPGGAISLTHYGDSYATPSGAEITLVDESPAARVRDVVDTDLKTQEVFKVAGEVVQDKRFMSILHYRHFNNTGPTSLSWREIGEKLSLSHEGCRKIYNSNIELVKRRLGVTTAMVSA